ncbi:2-oxo acid dehydrogenase subunit E2 [Halegenticoccus soli]|uniref:2-oxo acid dehydrogenase subunit E2 n=1 Tax=Halegenticoccus soli TaxID=1985678 RepID=UPI000C6EC9C7|nr:2-oxo acid dehydrogenase subunit E2 [Halegenticoccus soli]
MATKEFKLPDVGEGVAEGELVSWLVEPGDAVTEDQAVAEVETDKALVEVPSPYNGTVKELRAEEGEMVPVGEVIITFEVEGEEDEAASAESQERAEEPAELADAEEGGAAEGGGAETEEETATAETEEVETPGGRVFAAPSARRLARELGIDIAGVEGSGPGGRVTDADVRAAAEEGGAAGAEGETAGPRAVDVGGQSAVTERAQSRDGEGTTGPAPEAAGRDRTLAAPATRRLAEERGIDINDVPATEERDGQPFVTPEAVAEYAEAQRAAREAEVEAEAEAGAAAETAEAVEAPEPEPAAEGEVERVPYRGVRRTIGQQMERSKYTAPHVTHHDTVVIDELVELRDEFKELAAERGVKLTYMPFVMKALVAALKEFPELNSTLDEESGDEAAVVLKKYYNIGIAVATDAGLMVPVVRDVDKKSVLQLAREVNDLASRARERKVTREEMQGGTFTITNFGAIGGEYATPIINYPETAIMGLGAIEKRPVVEEREISEESRDANGETVSDVVVARETLPMSLSIDHRVIDGANAAAFTNRVMEHLRNPKLLLLE